MKASIELNGMHFHSYHGCLPEERKLGGEYLVDFRCVHDISVVSHSDNLSDTVDYTDIYSIVAAQMEIPSNLIENVASRILAAITESYPELEDVVITLTKLSPSLGSDVDSSSVTVKK